MQTLLFKVVALLGIRMCCQIAFCLLALCVCVYMCVECSLDGLLHVCVLFLFLRKPRINSQLVAQQVAQQYTMPPPAKKDRRERSERPDKERLDGEGEQACGEGRPGLERPESVKPEGDTPEKDKGDKEPPLKDKPDREKDISPALPKKPSSKKIRPKSDSHQSPPSDKQSIQSGKSATKTNKNSHISR
uniref:Uncharacterized protein n=1 Tax=Oryzias sinensis TaxID=183150 RepID=A0A8C7WYS5_9TELE